ncbi:MAG: hypothetical protein Q8Q02_13125 [Nocardioides sp.]|nr:hypothetical protein [Nocardioides sp.]
MDESQEHPTTDEAREERMTRLTDELDHEAAETGAPVELRPTGNVEVDAVLDTLAELADRPVDEHVAVFDGAHEALRRTLSDAGRPADG